MGIYVYNGYIMVNSWLIMGNLLVNSWLIMVNSNGLTIINQLLTID